MITTALKAPLAKGHGGNTFSILLFYCFVALGCHVIASKLPEPWSAEDIDTADQETAQPQGDEESVRGTLRRNLHNVTEATVEVCISDIESVLESRDGGANSIQVCASRVEGGITPSLGLVKEIMCRLKSSPGIEVHVLIRPRPGNFCYSSSEFNIMLRDICDAKDAGVDGIVVGILQKDSSLDVERMRKIRLVCGPDMQLTFHRAFDVCTHPTEALQQIIDLGCDRVLTSGRAPSVSSVEGIANLRKIVKQAAGRINVIAAAGITMRNVSGIIESTGVPGVHVGSSVTKIVDRRVQDLSASAFTTLSSNFGDPIIQTMPEYANASAKAAGGGFVALGPRVHADVEEEMSSWTCVDSTEVFGLASMAKDTWRREALFQRDESQKDQIAPEGSESATPEREASEDANVLSKASCVLQNDLVVESLAMSTGTLPIDTDADANGTAHSLIMTSSTSSTARMLTAPHISFSGVPTESTLATPKTSTAYSFDDGDGDGNGGQIDDAADVEEIDSPALGSPCPINMTYSYVHIGIENDESYQSSMADERNE